MIRIALLSTLFALLFSCGDASKGGTASSKDAEGKLFMRTMLWSSGTLDIAWYYMTADRIVVNPVGGADPVDWASETEKNGKNVASYRQAGDGTIQVEWGDGRKQNLRVEYKDGEISALDGGLMTLAKPFTASNFDGLTYTGVTILAQVTRTIRIDFGADGRFKMERVGSVSGGASGSGVGTDGRSDQGAYEIKGNTIHFHFDDGTEWHAVGQPYDLGNGEIIIGDQLFKKTI